MAEVGASNVDARPVSADRRRYRWVQLAATAALAFAFSVGSAMQARLLWLSGDEIPDTSVGQVGERLLANVAAVLLLLAIIAWHPTFGMRWPRKIAVLVVAGILGLVMRMVVQLWQGVHTLDRSDLLLTDAVAPAVTGSISLLVGVSVAEYDVRLRVQERLRAQQELRTSLAFQQLQTEELRVRRTVAEGLHTSVQQHLVLVESELDRLHERLIRGLPATPDDLALLDTLRAQVATLREQDVRGYSQMLYPVGVNMGLVQAIRVLFRRLPSSFVVSLHIDDSVVRADDPSTPLPVAFRILAIRVLEEAIANALRHGRAGHFQANIRVDDADGDARTLRLSLDDDGTPPQEDANWSGLHRLHEQLAEYGGSLSLAPSELGGARLTATAVLPVPGQGEG